MADGRIAVIISEIFDPLDYELLNGIYSQARKMKYDTVILTGIRDVRRTMYQELSSEKLDHVYSLVKYAEFDGVVYVADSFYDVNTEEKSKTKNLFALLTYKMLGIKNNKAEEFEREMLRRKAKRVVI